MPISFKLGLSLILSVVITLLCGTIYIAVHQNYRQSANDPQVQISESVAGMLSRGEDLTSILPEQKADLNGSLATFIIVYDDSQNPTVSTAQLDGQTPELPKGVLDFAKENGQNRVTWQPKAGVRIAAVVTRYDKGYVLAGRSIREVESRIKMLTKQLASAWFVTIIVAFLGTWFLIPKNKSH